MFRSGRVPQRRHHTDDGTNGETVRPEQSGSVPQGATAWEGNQPAQQSTGERERESKSSYIGPRYSAHSAIASL